MQFAKRLLMGVGAVALAAMVLSLTAPKAVHGMVAALVQVANTNETPVPTEEALGTQTLVQFSCPADEGTSPGIINSKTCYTVPAGSRAVIEQVDGSCNLLKGGGVITLTGITIGGVGASYNLPMQVQPDLGSTFGLDYTYYMFNQQVRIYAPPGAAIVFGSSTSDKSGTASCYFNVSGRLVPTS